MGFINATEAKTKTKQIVKDKDETYLKHMEIFKVEVSKAITEGEFHTCVHMLKPSTLAMTELRSLGYEVSIPPPQPRNSMERELMMKNTGNWASNIIIEWK